MDFTDKIGYKILQLICFIAGAVWIILKIYFCLSNYLFGIDLSSFLPTWVDDFIGFLTGIIIWFSYLFLTLVTHTQKLPSFTDSLTEFTKSIGSSIGILQKQLDQVTKTSIEVVKNATGFMERAFGLQVITKLREKYGPTLLEALQALGFNLRNWENHITKKLDGKTVLTDDKIKINIWLRYMRTYYFEEAFDIGRKEIITNGRNFCFILLATLQAFLENLKDGEKLHYYAVTPVNPKDWYNWPHGYEQPRVYFEEDFIGMFHRTLREIISSKEYKDKIMHGRYILTAMEENEQQFGWRLDKFETVKEQLGKTWIMPVAITIEDLEQCDDEVLRAFSSYYSWLTSTDRFPARKKESLIIPLFCEDWNIKLIEDWFLARKAKFDKVVSSLNKEEREVVKAFNILLELSKSGDGKELVKCAKSFHSNKLKISLENVKLSSDYAGGAEAYEELLALTNDIMNDKPIDFIKYIRQIHFYDILLSEHNQREKQDNLRLLLYSVLRLRDCQLMSNPPNPWPSLGEVFTKTLHSSPDLSYLIGLNKKNMEEWDKKNVKPEFSFFGIEDSSGIHEKLILATEMDYPFEVCKIKIIEPDDMEWNSYEIFINKLKDEKYKDYERYNLGANKS